MRRIGVVLRLDLAFKLVWKSCPGLTMANFALQLVQGVLPLLSLYLIKLIIDAVTGGMAQAEQGAAMRQILFYIVLAAAIALVDVGIQALGRFVNQAQSLVVTDRMHDVIHAKSVAVDLEYYENPQYFDTLHRAQQEAAFRPTKIVNSLAVLGKTTLSLLAMASLLFSFHWGLGLLLFASALPGLFVKIRYADTLYNWQRKHTKTERKAYYFNWLLTHESHAKEIRLFGLGALFIERYKSLRTILRQEKLSITAKTSFAEFLAQAWATLAVFGSYGFIAYKTVQGAITLGDLVMFFQAFQRGQSFLKEMLNSLAGLYEDNLFLNNLSEFLNLQPKIIPPQKPQPIPDLQHADIIFDRVQFRYPASSRDVLKDISLIIHPGEHVALVGENGSGKTTLVKMLCRLYDPDQGRILFGDTDLKDLDASTVRHKISVIFQDYVKYNLTARENIWLGNIDIPMDQAGIIKAARQSGAHDVISSLPQGYDTILGKLFEKGEEISVGEWQKVALARAFLRQAPILILDEPTSSLDAKVEYEIFEQFHKLTQGRTAILISHRLSTVRMADRIFVMQNGTISENGTHEELMKDQGLYATMFERQAKNYLPD
jgi:ATP-binding cassette, subfamily B, bacterial